MRDAYTHYVFVGPYAEWLSPEIIHMPDDETDPDGWNELLEGGMLHWSISYDTAYPPQIKRGRKLVYQYNCSPGRKCSGQPRTPMLLVLNAMEQPHLAADWGVIDTASEIEWFTQTCEQELARLERLFCHPPTLHWGVLYMYS